MPCCYVLVVDDDAVIRHLISQTLVDAGVIVEEAEDGERALELIERRPPCLILLDLRMPVMDGWALAAALLTRGIEVPIVVMTGSGVGHTAAQKLDARGYLAKPFSERELLRLVRAISRVDR